MSSRTQVTPCSEGKLLAIFMPPNGPIHVSNWSRMWWHCRGTAVVAFECDTFSSPDFDGYCQANCICGCRFGKRASRSGHTYRTGRVFMHSSCRNALCKGTWCEHSPRRQISWSSFSELAFLQHVAQCHGHLLSNTRIGRMSAQVESDSPSCILHYDMRSMMRIGRASHERLRSR